MRHRKKGRKLNRTWSHRKAMLRNMVTTFIDQEQIETTDAKAKELRPLAERLVTLAKRGGDDLAARRRALTVIRDRTVVNKLFTEIGPRYADRPGGYTRILKVESRKGDGAPLSILKFVTEPVTFKEKKQRSEDEVDKIRPSAAAAPVDDAAPVPDAPAEPDADATTPEGGEAPVKEPELAGESVEETSDASPEEGEAKEG